MRNVPRTWTQVGQYIWQCDDEHGHRRCYGEFPGGSEEVEEFYQQSEEDARMHALNLGGACED